MKDFKWHSRDVLCNIFYKIKLWAKLCTESNCHAFQNMDLTLSQKNTLRIQEKNQGYNSEFWLRFFLSNLSLTCYRLLIFPKWKGGYLFITYIYVSKNAFTIFQNKCREKILALPMLIFSPVVFLRIFDEQILTVLSGIPFKSFVSAEYGKFSWAHSSNIYSCLVGQQYSAYIVNKRNSCGIAGMQYSN